MVLEDVYRRDREQSIISYDWTDISDGTGLIGFYMTKDSASGNGILIKPALNEEKANLDDSEGDVDFDLSPFNLPKVIRGTAYASVTIWTDSTSTHSVTIQLKRVRDGVETNISDSISLSNSINNPPRTFALMMEIPINDKYDFKRGDKLRATMSCSTCTVRLQPQDNPSVVYVPFDIDR